jgi:hypothetical protein
MYDPLNDEQTQRRHSSQTRGERLQRRGFTLLNGMVLLALIAYCSNGFADDLIYSNASKFKIPFQLDQNELEKIGATEIQLYASQNMGASWRLHESVEPAASDFMYEAAADGVYWFSVRTKTSSGLTYPAGPHQAGLKVVVYTAKPAFMLDVTEVEPGRIELDWDITDDNLKLESLKLELLDPKLNQWDIVEFRSAKSGKTSWNVSKAGLVEVRGSVRDIAGNTTEIATQTIISGKMPFGSPMESRSRPIAADESSKAQMLSNQPIEVEVIPNRPRSILTSNQSQEIVLPKHLEKIPEQSLRPDEQLVLPRLEDAIRNGTLPERNSSPEVLPLKKLTPADVSIKNLYPQEQTLKRMESESIDNNQLKSIQPIDSLKKMESVLEQPQPTQFRTGHLVNSSTFRIAYELEDVGPSGVSKIELYITENGGTSWFHYGSDNDRTSPIVAKVPRDGNYGFSFRIRNGAGLVATPPQPGERPEINVSVDQTAPTANLEPIQQGQALHQNQIVIKWNASDRELDENPIALYYATQETGPWELIKGWTANSGTLPWTVPSAVQSNFYIRLDVRDAAGNITRIDGETAYTVDQSRPKARITDVESLRNDSVRQ